MNAVEKSVTESRNSMNSLLGARRETISLYTELVSLRPFNDEHDVTVVLQEFCETLMDYTASAHFQLYRFLEDGTERRSNVRDLAKKIYPNISNTTEQFLDFNDKYEVEEKGQHLTALDKDLSSLGEMLADRIVYEDQVISAFGSKS